MDNNELLSSIKDVSKDREILYQLLSNLGITYKKTNCRKCLNDLYNIALEEMGIIKNAAEKSEFDRQTKDGKWVYVCNRPQTWKGHIIDQNTPEDVIVEFVKAFPNGCYRRTAK